MRPKAIYACLIAACASLSLAGTAGAALIGVYRNGMGTQAQRQQILKLSGKRCSRGSAGGAIRIVVGKQTSECAYRTPVMGRDLEIAATERLLAETPAKTQRGA